MLENRTHSKSSIKNRGVALLISLFSIMMLSFIAVEVSYDTSIDYIISSKEYHKLRAYYAAKSGVELSLLRISLYQKAVFALNNLPPALKGVLKKSMLNMIWNFPLSWPITLPADLSTVDKQSIDEISGESLLEGVKYETKITSEGSKIDLTSFTYGKPALADATKQQLVSLFRNYLDSLETDSPLEDVDYERVIGNIQDWVDHDEKSFDNRSESSLYEEENLPPNRAFRTVEELRMVSGITNDVFNFLLPHITVYGAAGINPNNASDIILASIHPNITDQVVARMHDYFDQTGPFNDVNEFFNFLSRFNVPTNEIERSSLYFSDTDGEINFSIKSVGQSGSINKEIQVVVYDKSKISAKLGLNQNPQNNPGQNPPGGATQPPSGGTTAQNPTPGGNPGQNPPGGAGQPTPGANPAQNTAPPDKRPTIIYWYEN